MNRGLIVAAALVAAVAACSPPPEEPILGGFFNASRLRDRTALQKLATASFDPAADGIITTFEITGVVTRQEGGRVTKEVSISAPVRLLNGETLHKDLVVTLARDVSGRVFGPPWIVTAIRDAAAGPLPPPR